MMNTSKIEKRVSDLEREVATLREKVQSLSAAQPWWERIAGTFENDPVYKQAMKLGREYRCAQQPNRKKKS